MALRCYTQYIYNVLRTVVSYCNKHEILQKKKGDYKYPILLISRFHSLRFQRTNEGNISHIVEKRLKRDSGKERTHRFCILATQSDSSPFSILKLLLPATSLGTCTCSFMKHVLNFHYLTKVNHSQLSSKSLTAKRKVIE